MNQVSLKITEIFLSLQGEAHSVGYPTVFIRLTGCPLRCHYCDSEYAFFGGERILIEDILAKVAAFGVHHVCVTGGEPLAQPGVHSLLIHLSKLGYSVSLETSGALAIDGVDEAVSIVMDIKTPSSGEVGRNCVENIDLLRANDQVKFVLGDRQDYEWALFKVAEYALKERVADILFSPVAGQLPPRELADWIITDRAPVRFQFQLHKMLWGDKPGH